MPAAAVLTSSGTMSMQCALAGIPGAIAYRANPLTYLIGRWLVRVRHLGIANIMLDQPMYPEFIQGVGDPGGAGRGAARLHSRSRPAASHGGTLRGRVAGAAGAAGWGTRRGSGLERAVGVYP